MTQQQQSAVGARRAFTILIPIALCVFILDQVSKVWAERTLEVGAPGKDLVGSFIRLRLIYNPGAALSLGTRATIVLTIVSAVVAVGLIWVTPRLTTKTWVSVAALLLGGTVGNLADRLLRNPGFPKGHVVDFIDYGPFIGNVADIAIVAAAILIALLSVMGSAPLVEKPVARLDGSADKPQDEVLRGEDALDEPAQLAEESSAAEAPSVARSASGDEE